MKRMILFVSVLWLCLTFSFGVEAQQSRRQTNPPTSSPTTAFGELVRVECREKASVTTLNLVRGALQTRNEVMKSREGQIFIILHFTGRAAPGMDVIRAVGDTDVIRAVGNKGSNATFVKLARAIGASSMKRINNQSWITGSTGAKYDKAYVVPGVMKRQLAFEVPENLTDLTWHDGKKSFPLGTIPDCSLTGTDPPLSTKEANEKNSLLSTQTQQSRGSSVESRAGKLTQTYKGLEITVLSADLVTKADNRDCPPKNIVITLAPLDGTPVARIRLKIKVLPGYKPMEVSRVELYGTDNQVRKPLSSFGNFSGIKTCECDLFFMDVPQDFKFKTLKLEEISFDLEKLQVN